MRAPVASLGCPRTVRGATTIARRGVRARVLPSARRLRVVSQPTLMRLLPPDEPREHYLGGHRLLQPLGKRACAAALAVLPPLGA
jgi:hypothetical protein